MHLLEWSKLFTYKYPQLSIFCNEHPSFIHQNVLQFVLSALQYNIHTSILILVNVLVQCG